QRGGSEPGADRGVVDVSAVSVTVCVRVVRMAVRWVVVGVCMAVPVIAVLVIAVPVIAVPVIAVPVIVRAVPVAMAVRGLGVAAMARRVAVIVPGTLAV